MMLKQKGRKSFFQSDKSDCNRWRQLQEKATGIDGSGFLIEEEKKSEDSGS